MTVATRTSPRRHIDTYLRGWGWTEEDLGEIMSVRGSIKSKIAWGQAYWFSAVARSFSSVSAKQAAQWGVWLLLCTHRHLGKQALGPKMQYHPPKYAPRGRQRVLGSPPVLPSTTVRHCYWDGDFLWRTSPHLPRVKERWNYLAVFSKEPKLFLELADSRKSLPLH